MPSPTTSNVARPRAFYGLALNDRLFRLATRFSPVNIETSPPEAPRVNTASNPDEIVEEHGRIFARSSFEGGEGLFRAHVEGAEQDRFWASSGVKIAPTDQGELPEVTLATAVSSAPVSTTDALGVRLVRTSDELLFARGVDVRVSDDPLASSPTFATEDPHDANTPEDVRGLAALGDTVYAAIGTSGIHRRVGGVWGHWSDLPSTAVWTAQGRVLASDGDSLYEVTASGAGPSATTVLDAGQVFTSVADAGLAVLAGSTDGRVRAYTSESGTLVLAGQTLFEGEQVVSLSSTRGLVAVGTRSGRIGRLWVGTLASSFALADLQLVREWDGTRTRVPWRIIAGRTSFYAVVVAETGRQELDVWRYDVSTSGLSHHLAFPLDGVIGLDDGGTAYQSGADTDLLIFDGTMFHAFDGYGVSRQASTFVADGYLIGPLGDFFSASPKSWVGARLDSGDPSPGAVELFYTTSPEALLDPDSSLWKRAIYRSVGASTEEVPLEGVTSRWIAGMVRMSTDDTSRSPTFRAFGFRGFASAGEGDVVLTLPVDVSDQVERRGRHRVRVKGLGRQTYQTLKALEGRAVLAELYRPAERVRGMVETVETPVVAVSARGSVTHVSQVTVRGRRTPASVAPVVGTFGAYTYGETPFGGF